MFHAFPRATGRLMAVVVLTTVVLSSSTGRAFAHDQLIGSSPTSGQHLDAAPSEIRLEYSADVMDLGAAVVLADVAGTEWAAGAPALDGATATVAVAPGLPDGAYTVRWRVVSCDGHAISGAIPFTVGDAQVASPTPTPTAAAQQPSPSASSSSARAADRDETPPKSPLGRTAAIAVAGAAGASALYALFLLWQRRSAMRRHPQ